MATLVLPARNDLTAYDFQVQLEGAWYGFALRWNSRAGYWFVTISDVNGDILSAGRKVVIGPNLKGASVDPRLPPGAVMAYDSSGSNLDAGLTDLGSRVLLLYVESTGP